MSETHPIVTPTVVPPPGPSITPGDVCWVMRTLDRSRLEPPRANYFAPTIQRMLDSYGGLPEQFHVVDSKLSADVWFARDLPGWADQFLYYAGIHDVSNNENARRALKIGLGTRLPWIVHLEDDLDVCEDFFGSVCRWLTDERATGHRLVPLYTFHAPYKGVEHAVAAGETAWLYPVSKFYGNQCWAMTRGMALSALAYLEDRMTTWPTGQGFDLILKEWATSIGHDYFVASVPSFVQHVGEASSLHLGRFHQNGSFPGRDWRYEGRLR